MIRGKWGEPKKPYEMARQDFLPQGIFQEFPNPVPWLYKTFSLWATARY
jgi:hypothetical protein